VSTTQSGEAEVLAILQERLERPPIFSFLSGVAYALERRLLESEDVKSTQVSIPLDRYDGSLPTDIKSSWVFVLRKDHPHEAERHPNSIQRMFALDTAGAMEVWRDDAWRREPLFPGAKRSGLSIPALAWHRPATLDHTWAVVSFHTVAAADLIEETGDPLHQIASAERRYERV